jgi:hypothetical protein
MSPAFAHGVGRVYESPLPLWLYLVGAAATVLISFLIRSLAERSPARGDGRVVAGPRTVARLLGVFRIAALAVLGLIVLFAFLDPEPGFTVTPLLFWVFLIVGTVLICSVIAGLWERTNPWATIESFYRLEGETVDQGRSLPGWLGPLLVYGLFWFELVSGRGFDPVAILLVVAAYTVFALSFRSATNWKEIDPLSILFGFASRIAPLEVDERRGLVSRGALTGLDEARAMSWPLFASVLILLASTTLDNLRETVEWNSFLHGAGLEQMDSTLLDSLALALLTLPFLITFVAAVAISRRWMSSDVSIWETVRVFGWSLIPIGIAYVLAHNMSLLIIGVPELIARVVDSLGADLFSAYSPSPQLVWVLAILFVVGGHVLGVLAAHRAALRLTGSHAAAVRSHTALTLLMSLYTVSTLWLLSLPLVTEA